MQTNDLTSEWHDAAARDQLDEAFPLGIEVLGHPVGIYLHNYRVDALEDVCPHAFAKLSPGFQEGGLIECPLHAACFEIAIRKCLNEIGQLDISCFPARVTEGHVQVRVLMREEASA